MIILILALTALKIKSNISVNKRNLVNTWALISLFNTIMILINDIYLFSVQKPGILVTCVIIILTGKFVRCCCCLHMVVGLAFI